MLYATFTRSLRSCPRSGIFSTIRFHVVTDFKFREILTCRNHSATGWIDSRVEMNWNLFRFRNDLPTDAKMQIEVIGNGKMRNSYSTKSGFEHLDRALDGSAHAIQCLGSILDAIGNVG